MCDDPLLSKAFQRWLDEEVSLTISRRELVALASHLNATPYKGEDPNLDSAFNRITDRLNWQQTSEGIPDYE